MPTKHIEKAIENGDVLSPDPAAVLQFLTPKIPLNLRAKRKDKDYMVVCDERSKVVRHIEYDGVPHEMLASIFVYARPVGAPKGNGNGVSW